MMNATVKFDGDGSVIENTVTGVTSPSAIPELQQLVRIVKGVAYAVSDSYSDDKRPEGTAEYAAYLNDKSSFLGSLQSDAVSYYTSEYRKANNLGDAVQIEPLRDAEHKVVSQGNLLDDVSEGTRQDIEIMGDRLQVPLTPGGEAMPVMVSDEHDAYHNLDEAKEIVESLMDHIDFDGEPEQSNDTTKNSASNNSDSDDESDLSVNDPCNIDGIGEGTIEKVEEGGFEIVPREPEAEPFDFETGVTDETQEITTGEVFERLEAVEDDMDDFKLEVAKERLKDKDLKDALSIIEDFE